MSVEEQGVLRHLRGRSCWVVGCGYLGSSLLALCREAGMLALGIDRELPADVQGEAASSALLASARSLVEPELIFCTVATHGGDETAYRAAYQEVPRALHAACPAARLMFCSSSSVYGGQRGEVVVESSPCHALSSRARLLLEAEAAVLAMGGRVARLVPLYGDGRCELLRRWVRREPELPGADSRVLNYVHVADAARALLYLVRAEGVRLVNVCADSFTKSEVYGALSGFTGLPRVTTVAEGGRRGVSDQLVSSALLRSLGWEPQMQFLPWATTHWRDWL